MASETDAHLDQLSLNGQREPIHTSSGGDGSKRAQEIEREGNLIKKMGGKVERTEGQL